MILQNISRRVVDNVLINISPSTIFLNMLSLKRFHQNCQADLAVVSINGLTLLMPYMHICVCDTKTYGTTRNGASLVLTHKITHSCKIPPLSIHE